MTTQLPTPVPATAAKVAKNGGLIAGLGAVALIVACAAGCAIPVVAAASARCAAGVG